MESAAHLKETLEGINISREKAEKFPCEGRLSLGDDPGGYRANRCSSGMDGGAARFLPPDEGDDGASLIRLPPRDPYLTRGESLARSPLKLPPGSAFAGLESSLEPAGVEPVLASAAFTRWEAKGR